MKLSYVEWLQGPGGELILTFLENPTEKRFKAIYKELTKQQKRNKNFLPRNEQYQLGFTMSTIYARGLKLEEAKATQTLKIFADLAANLTGDENWRPPDTKLPQTYPAYEVWFRTRLGKPIPAHLTPTHKEIQPILPPPIL